jgi:GntR family transcriptional regulator
MTIDKQSIQGGAPPITFRLDPGSGVPTYLQLVQQVEQALRLGYLSQGDQLPTVKDVVAALAINPNTVLKAYRELEHRGLAVGRPGQGTFIEGTLRHVGIAEQNSLRKALVAWLQSADSAGLDEDGIVAIFQSALRDFREHRATGRPAGRDRGAATGTGLIA